jgi:hypothetical protein
MGINYKGSQGALGRGMTLPGLAWDFLWTSIYDSGSTCIHWHAASFTAKESKCEIYFLGMHPIRVQVHKIQSCFTVCIVVGEPHGCKCNNFIAFWANAAKNACLLCGLNQWFLGDITNLALIWSKFSSIKTCFLLVLLLPSVLKTILRNCKLSCLEQEQQEPRHLSYHGLGVSFPCS